VPILRPSPTNSELIHLQFVFYTAIAVLLTAGIATPAASAQTLQEFASCTSVDNDIERLACFDRVATPLMNDEAAETTCISMTVEDLKLDYNDILGTCAEVAGFVLQAGDSAMLMQSMMDANPFFIDTSELSRDERRILLNCPSGCELMVTGTVGEFNYNKGMKASSVRQ